MAQSETRESDSDECDDAFYAGLDLDGMVSHAASLLMHGGPSQTETNSDGQQQTVTGAETGTGTGAEARTRSAAVGAATATATAWACIVCTFLNTNPTGLACEICQSVRATASELSAADTPAARKKRANKRTSTAASAAPRDWRLTDKRTSTASAAPPHWQRMPTDKHTPTAAPPDWQVTVERRMGLDAKRGQRMHPWQHDVLSAWLEGRDVLVLSGTGSGKSLCFQAPVWLARTCVVAKDRSARTSTVSTASVTPKAGASQVVVVVSPLIALMRDQVLQLQDKRKDKDNRITACKPRMITSRPLLQNGAKNRNLRCVLVPAPEYWGGGARLECRIKG